MKNLVMILAAALTFSSNAFANDIGLANALFDAGAQGEVVLGKMIVAVDNLECGRARKSGVLICTMTELNIENYGSQLTVTGAAAQNLVNTVGAYRAKHIDCTTYMEDLIDIEEGEQYSCAVDFGLE